MPMPSNSVYVTDSMVQDVEDELGMGAGAWDTIDPKHIVSAVMRLFPVNPIVRQLLIACDSELSAIAHGRPPSPKAELLALSDRCRAITK